MGSLRYTREVKLGRLAGISAIRTNSVVSEIVPTAAGEALFAVPFATVRPFGSAALASSIRLQGVADEIVVA
jgi:hypothetical protein